MTIIEALDLLERAGTITIVNDWRSVTLALSEAGIDHEADLTMAEAETIAPGARVVLACKGFEGETGTIVERYGAPGAQPDEWVVERDNGGDWPYMAVRERDLTPIGD
jgi:hypothetical protein